VAAEVAGQVGLIVEAGPPGGFRRPYSTAQQVTGEIDSTGQHVGVRRNPHLAPEAADQGGRGDAVLLRETLQRDLPVDAGVEILPGS